MLTLSPSAAKCEQSFSAMNHLKCNLQTTLGQNTLSDFMWMRSLDQTIQWKPTDRTLLSVTGFQEQRQRDTFSRYSNWLQALPNFQQICWWFIPGTSFKLVVQTRNWNISYSSLFNCFIVDTLSKLLKALSNINWQCLASQHEIFKGSL